MKKIVNRSNIRSCSSGKFPGHRESEGIPTAVGLLAKLNVFTQPVPLDV